MGTLYLMGGSEEGFVSYTSSSGGTVGGLCTSGHTTWIVPGRVALWVGGMGWSGPSCRGFGVHLLLE